MQHRISPARLLKMRVTAAAVMTKDGFIAQSDKTMIPVSPEDTALLSTQLTAHEVHVMGATTFMNMEPQFTKKYAHKRYVLTNTPKTYVTYAHLATFIADDLAHLLKNLQNKGANSVLILGGNSLYDPCVRYALADTLRITVEPSVLRKGIPFLSDVTWLRDNYTLASETSLNKSGTLLRTYTKK